MHAVRASNRFRVTFETNRYSVPAEYASQRLTLKAWPDRLCVYHHDRLVARHPRSYDRHRDFEDPDHPKALLAQRHSARRQRLLKRFLTLAPCAERYYAQLQQRRLNAIHHIRKIVALSEIHGEEATARALTDALHFGALGSEYIANLLESRARLSAGARPPAPHPTQRCSGTRPPRPRPRRLRPPPRDGEHAMNRPPKVDLDAFHADLDTLQLAFVREHYPDFVHTAAQHQWDHLPLLARLLEGEAARRRDRASARRIRLARFPVRKTLDTFDWTWPKKINRPQVMNLFRLHFVEQARNVVFIGGVGLGKSHLAIALGLRACEEHYSVRFASAVDVINTLAAAQATGRLKQGLDHYIKPRVLVLDELGYLPIDKTGADLLFQIVSQRYERASTLITTNRVYRKWSEIFNNDATLTSAVLDRLLHHAETILIEGKSFRMKDANPKS